MPRHVRITLLASLALTALALAGCGGSGSASSCAEAEADAPVYAVVGNAAAVARAICDRARRLQYKDAAVSVVDRGHVAVEVPKVTETPESQWLFLPFDIHFYDWEPNVLTDPSRGAGGGPVPISGAFPAVEFASRQKPRTEKEDIPPGGPSEEVERRFNGDQAEIQRHYDRLNDSAGDKFFLFGPGEGPTRRLLQVGQSHGEPLGLAFESCEQIVDEYEGGSKGQASGADVRVPRGSACRNELRRLGSAGLESGSEVVKVPRGIVVILNEKSAQPPENSRTPSQFFVIEDDSELTGADIKDPEQGFDRNTNAPNVSFEFTDRGKAAFENVTRRIAQRGLLAGDRQNFAIALDNVIVSIAYIDPGRYPEGIDGSNGAEIAGVGDVDSARRLAGLLEFGPLPAPVTRIR